jgi:polar amino acid transport system substrate-binding protein
MKLPRFILLTMVAGLLALGAIAAACEDDEDDGGDATPTTEGTTADGTPAEAIDISNVPELEDGVISVGSDIAYAPIEFFEEGTQNAVGLDIDIMNAMAEVLGVEAEFTQVADFAAIVEDVQSRRYDAVMSAISITSERQAEIDMIPYFGPVGTGILVAAGNPEGIAGPEDLCGKAISAQVGTIQVEQIEGGEDYEGINTTTCADNPATLTTFPDNPTAVQELTLGRVVASLSDDPVAQYSALQSDGELEVAVTRFPDAAEYGIGINKESTELRSVLEDALEQIIADGTYADILEEWGQTDFAIQ